MSNNSYVDRPETIKKFLKDPEVSDEIKEMCFKLIENPLIAHLVEKAPVNVIFEICGEYKKHMAWYDDIFSGKIKIYLKGLMNEALPLYSYIGIQNDYNLKMFFGSKTLTGEIVEKFAACDAQNNKINRITVRIKDNKLLTAGFDSRKEIKAMVVDFIDFLEEGSLVKLLNNTPHKRVDFIRL